MKRSRPPRRTTSLVTSSRNQGSKSAHPDQPGEASAGERLQKVLASAGYGSRRACEEYIEMGRVTIDGVVAKELGVRVDLSRQKVAVDGEKLRVEEKRYFLFHKPAGVLCTNSDPAGRTRVIDCFPPNVGRLFTVGRLDDATEGLLIVTNDGDLAERLTHPKFGIPRIYRAVVAGNPSTEAINQLLEGLYFAEGRFRMSSVNRVKSQGSATVLEITMREGQNREIRRLLARVGHKVMKLKRTNFGPIKLGDLERGAHRKLSEEELGKLQDVITGKWKEPAPRKPQRTRDAGKATSAGASTRASSSDPGSAGGRSRAGLDRTALPSAPTGLEPLTIPGSRLKRLGSSKESNAAALTAPASNSRETSSKRREDSRSSGGSRSSAGSRSSEGSPVRRTGKGSMTPEARQKPASRTSGGFSQGRPGSSRTTARQLATNDHPPVMDDGSTRLKRRVLDGEGSVISSKKLRGAAPRLNFPQNVRGNDAADGDEAVNPPPLSLLKSGRRVPRTKDHLIAHRSASKETAEATPEKVVRKKASAKFPGSRKATTAGRSSTSARGQKSSSSSNRKRGD